MVLGPPLGTLEKISFGRLLITFAALCGVLSVISNNKYASKYARTELESLVFLNFVEVRTSVRTSLEPHLI